MKMKNNLMWALSLIIMGSLLMLSACGDDEKDPVAPVLSIDTPEFTGDIGDQVTATISGELDGEFVSLTITKYIGADVDATYGTGGSTEVTTGLPYTFNYTLGVDGILQAVRFNFLVTDANGLTDDVNLIITTELTRSGLIVAFNWQYSSLLFDADGDGTAELESIQDCEKDNIFNFESDGTMGIDHGALTGSGGGSCDFDDAVDYTRWEFDANEEVLSLIRVDINPNDGSTTPKDTLRWTITEMDQTGFSATEESIFGPLVYGYSAVAKD